MIGSGDEEIPAPPPQRFSALAYCCVCLNAVALKYYELTDWYAYTGLTEEDSLIETLTAVLLFSASILLFATGRMERKSLCRWIYVMGGTVLLFIAGEEISWGQRIFGYPTPDWVAERNNQKEFTVHNFPSLQIPLRDGFRYGFLLLCTVACMAFLTGRERIWGIPVPSILLTLGLLATLSYIHPPYRPNFFVSTLRNLSGAHNILICLIIFALLVAGNTKLLIFSAAAILLSLSLGVVNHFEIFVLDGRSPRHEGCEYLMPLGIFCYSLELFLNQRPFVQADRWVRRSTPDRGRASIGPFVRRLALVGRLYFRVSGLAIPALSISISIGLMASAYVTSRARETYATELAQEIVSREPIIRSHFNVYMSQNRIIYYKEHCSRDDVRRPFFLLLIPTDLHASPIASRFSFFESGTASYREKARRRRRSCFLAQPLPRREIAGIVTGQESLWRAFPLHPTNAFRRTYDAVVSREPRVRSDFDIYLLNGRIGIFFVKEPCLRSDIEATFFLHVEPVDNASLPSHRQAHGFDNLDFRFSDFGTVFDDKCIAFVPLPAYDMSRIRTGQYLSEKRLWGVEFPFHIGESPASPGA